jgi:hypothetical protein
MNSLLRHLTYYLAAWLCFSGFLAPLSLVQANGNPCFPPVGKFCTYNQHHYGDPNSPVHSLLTTHFPSLFPHGLPIGAGVYLDVHNLLCSVLNLVLGLLDTVLDLLFVSAYQVVAFLPQVGGVAGPLVPGTTPADAPVNCLAGDTLALALNVALDANIDLFSATHACKLTDLYVCRGPCAGLSVAVVLNIANQILGNTCPLPILGKAPLTIAANIDLCVANINNDFLAGAAANHFLVLPGLHLKAIVDVCLSLPAITADVHASLVVKGVGSGCPLSVQLNVGAFVKIFRAWRCDTHQFIAGSPVPVGGLVLPLPSVVGGLLDGVLSLVGALLDVVLDDTLCLVNYLLNNKPFHASVIDIQAVIILLLNPGLNVYALLSLGFPCNPQLVLAILADVRLNGVGFLPAPGQIVAVFAKVQLAGGINAKVLLEILLPPLIGVDIDADLCIAL